MVTKEMAANVIAITRIADANSVIVIPDEENRLPVLELLPEF
jgi:hypothetical protein